MPNKYNKPGLRSTEDQNGGHGVILCDVGPEDQGLPGRVRLRFDFLGLYVFLSFDLHLIFVCVACKIQVGNMYRKVTSSRPAFYSILNPFGQRSQYISIEFHLL